MNIKDRPVQYVVILPLSSGRFFAIIYTQADCIKDTKYITLLGIFYLVCLN